MARRYGRNAGQQIEKRMHEMRRGKLRSGRGGKKSKKSKTGHCDRIIGSAEKGRQSSRSSS